MTKMKETNVVATDWRIFIVTPNRETGKWHLTDIERFHMAFADMMVGILFYGDHITVRYNTKDVKKSKIEKVLRELKKEKLIEKWEEPEDTSKWMESDHWQVYLATMLRKYLLQHASHSLFSFHTLFRFIHFVMNPVGYAAEQRFQMYIGEIAKSRIVAEQMLMLQEWFEKVGTEPGNLMVEGVDQTP